jgi:LPS-assembly protein
MRRPAALAVALAVLALAGGLAAQETPAPPPAAPPAPVAPPAPPAPVTPPGTVTPPAAPAPVTPPPTTSPGEAPGTPPAPVAQAAPLAPNRIAFEFPLAEDRGGGKVAGEADRLETSADQDAVLEGNVELRYKDMHFRADRLVLHGATSTFEAEGDVVFDQGPRRIASARLDFDLATRTGTFWNAAAAIEPDYYFSGAVVAKTGEQDYEIRDGVFTSCTGDETPDWSLRTSRANVEIGGYAHIRHARMRAKKLPVFYWPYMVWPARTERTSGLLIPNLGYSQRRGAYLGLAYYQVMGPSADGTLFLDGYTEGFAGLGGELRWRPSEGSKGSTTLYFLRDPDTRETEWRARFDQVAEGLPWGLRGVVSFEDYSDYGYFRQFERAERQNTKRFLYANAFLSGTWGAQSLNLLADQRETFVTDDRTTTQSQLPELSYRVTKLKLGDTRLYLSVDSTASFLQSSSTGLYDVGYGRFDLSPSLTLPLRVAPWLSVALSAGGRATWWGDTVAVARIDPVTGTSAPFCGDRAAAPGEAYCGESLDRVVPLASLVLIGPSLSRIFEGEVGRFGKFKHIVEPRWTWSYSGDFDEQASVARFDEIDPFVATHVGQLALVNRLLAKPSDEAQGGAFEILSLEFAQSYSFDDTQPLQRSRDGLISSQESPLSSRLRLNLSQDFNLQANAVWSTLFGGLRSTSLTARGEVGRAAVDLTWFTDYNVETSEKTSDQARLGLAVDLLPKRLRLVGTVSYDLAASQIQQQRYFLSWTSQCWSVQLEAREQITRTFTSRDYRFMLNLKNVGTFLDLTSGESSTEF